MTEWRRLPTTPYRAYEVSFDGRVRRRWRELVGEVDRYGYRRVLLSYAGLSKRFKVHRLICEAWHGPCPEGHECGHLDGNPANNRADNLAWVTRSQNTRDQIRHGTFAAASNLRHASGEAHHKAKLTAAQAANIKGRLTHERQADLAREFGVSFDCIADIKHGRRWARVEPAKQDAPRCFPHGPDILAVIERDGMTREKMGDAVPARAAGASAPEPASRLGLSAASLSQRAY